MFWRVCGTLSRLLLVFLYDVQCRYVQKFKTTVSKTIVVKSTDLVRLFPVEYEIFVANQNFRSNVPCRNKVGVSQQCQVLSVWQVLSRLSFSRCPMVTGVSRIKDLDDMLLIVHEIYFTCKISNFDPQEPFITFDLHQKLQDSLFKYRAWSYQSIEMQIMGPPNV